MRVCVQKNLMSKQMEVQHPHNNEKSGCRTYSILDMVFRPSAMEKFRADFHPSLPKHFVPVPEQEIL